MMFLFSGEAMGLDTALKIRYLKCLNRLQGKDLLAAVVFFGAASTIRGKKPSTLLAFSRRRKNVFSLWHCYKQEICKKFNLDYYELKNTAETVTVLFYKQKILERVLNKKNNLCFLNSLGYQDAVNLEAKLGLLKNKFASTCPHEVGIFLGFPVEDVIGFIMNKGKNYLLAGHWKVYLNRERAEMLFEIYDQARIEAAGVVIRCVEAAYCNNALAAEAVLGGWRDGIVKKVFINEKDGLM
ncbi:MAG: DUF3793 family protein [Peptococcaceae bacterium]|nr:DUF3793 family protein [Candidatus Syntrophopropionicum ammoniitolerans]